MSKQPIPVRRRQGMALVMVITVVAVAAVMGYAMLANNTLQSRVGSNAKLGAQADSLAESGIQIAMYKLQNLSERDVGNGLYGPVKTA